MHVFYTMRHYIDTFLKNCFSSVHYDVTSGLVLGGSSRVGKDLQDVFSRAGVLHILAVSGLHVGFVCFFIGCILLFIPISPKIKFAIIMVVLFMYAGMTGFRPSVCRASLMALLFGLAIILQRNVAPLHIVTLTALVFLIFNPLLLFDVGTQLSFAAVYGILYLYPRIDAVIIRKIKGKFLSFITASMGISFAAVIFVAPLLIYYFHRLPTLVILSNLCIVPLASVIIFSLFLSFLTGIIYMPFATLIAQTTSFLVEALIIISRVFAHVPFSTLSIHMSPLLVLPLYFLCSHRTRKIAAGAILILAILFATTSLSDCIVMKVAPTGVLLTTPDGTTTFITSRRWSVTTAAFLRNQGVGKVDYLIAPTQFYPTDKQFIEAPAQLHYKRIAWGTVSTTLEKNVAIQYRNHEFVFDDEYFNHEAHEDDARYVITDGNSVIQLTTPLHGSLIDQLVVDIKVVLIKLRFLF
jgi:ComEC/Rec2-related protein